MEEKERKRMAAHSVSETHLETAEMIKFFESLYKVESPESKQRRRKASLLLKRTKAEK